jgi:hypothetical protein
VRSWLNGAAQGERERVPGAIAADVVAIGARFYSNTGEPPHVQGFFDGDIANVLIYRRVLDEQERAKVEHFLNGKSFVTQTPGRKFVALEMVTNDSPVRMFLPGFEAKQLPVHLNNINCIKYREDGKLVALGYDGNIWLLTDTDADGLEDKAFAFFGLSPLCGRRLGWL